MLGLWALIAVWLAAAVVHGEKLRYNQKGYCSGVVSFGASGEMRYLVSEQYKVKKCARKWGFLWKECNYVTKTRSVFKRKYMTGYKKMNMNGEYTCNEATFRGVPETLNLFNNGLLQCKCLELDRRTCVNFKFKSGPYNDRGRYVCTHKDNPDVTTQWTCDKEYFGRLCDKRCVAGSTCFGGSCDTFGNCKCFHGYSGHTCARNDICKRCDTGTVCAFEDKTLRRIAKTEDFNPTGRFASSSGKDRFATLMSHYGQKVAAIRCVPPSRSFDGVELRDGAGAWGDPSLKNIEPDSRRGTAQMGSLCQSIGQYGERCQFTLQKCEGEPCGSGRCAISDSDVGYQCLCDKGYYGAKCTHSVDQTLGFNSVALPNEEYRSPLKTEWLPVPGAGVEVVNVMTVAFTQQVINEMADTLVEVKLEKNHYVEPISVFLDLKAKTVSTGDTTINILDRGESNKGFFNVNSYSFNQFNKRYFYDSTNPERKFKRDYPAISEIYPNDGNQHEWVVRFVLHDFIPYKEKLKHYFGWRLYINDVLAGFGAFDLTNSLMESTVPYQVSINPLRATGVSDLFVKVQRQIRTKNRSKRVVQEEEAYTLVSYQRNKHKSSRDPRHVRSSGSSVGLATGAFFMGARDGDRPTCTLSDGMVILSGTITRKDINRRDNGDAVVYLPKECRPKESMMYRVSGRGDGGAVMVQQDGDVLLNKFIASVSLNGISFLQVYDPDTNVFTSGLPYGISVLYNKVQGLCEIQGTALLKDSQVLKLPKYCQSEGDKIIRNHFTIFKADNFIQSETLQVGKDVTLTNSPRDGTSNEYGFVGFSRTIWNV